MTLDDYLKQVQELCDGATPGEWHIGHVSEASEACDINDKEGNDICSVYNRRDQAFICQSRTIVPRLVQMVKVLREQRDAWIKDYFESRVKHEFLDIDTCVGGHIFSCNAKLLALACGVGKDE